MLLQECVERFLLVEKVIVLRREIYLVADFAQVLQVVVLVVEVDAVFVLLFDLANAYLKITFFAVQSRRVFIFDFKCSDIKLSDLK